MDDLALIMEALMCEDAWKKDPSLIPLKFDAVEYQNTKKLKIGPFFVVIS